MAQQIQFRGDTAANWTTVDPILAAREIGVETDTNLYKIGNGSSLWSALSYYTLAPVLAMNTLEVKVVEPSTPSAGNMHLYSKSIAGRALLKIKGSSGLDTTIQNALFANGIQAYLPASAAVMNVIGGPALTVVGTLSHPALAGTNLRTQTARASILSAALTNSAVDIRVSRARVWRGNIVGGGGFFHRTRFAIASEVENQRAFIGLQASAAAFALTVEPRTLLTMVGIGNGLGETTLRIYHNDDDGEATEIDLGVDFPANDPTVVYDFSLFCSPNDNKISYEVLNLTTNASATGILTTDLPLETTFLAYRAYMNNGATVAAVTLDIMRIYTETDY